MAIGISIVPLLAWLVFDEQTTFVYWIGIVFVMFGVAADPIRGEQGG